MISLLTITWDMSRGIDFGAFTLRYYSLLFALGFVLGYMIMKRIFDKEGVPQEKLDTLLTYVVVATIIGARLGHVFFYPWDYYSVHPGEILKIWEGGLASHGAAVAIVIAIILYCRRSLKKPVLWMLDRLVITIALAGALIRMGNWFNSEIYGAIDNSSLQTVYTDPPRQRVLSAFDRSITEINYQLLNEEVVTDSIIYPVYKMEFVFSDLVRDNKVANTIIKDEVRPYVNRFDKEDQNILFQPDEELQWDIDKPNTGSIKVLGVPRHPTQIYEAIGYFLIFLTLFRLFQISSIAQRQGFIFGMFLILIFGFRFFIEYLKENQVSSEEGKLFNIGQYLSIPLVLAGLIMVIRSKKTNK